MLIKFNVTFESSIKEFITKKISRNFYGFLREHNVLFNINGLYATANDLLHVGDLLLVAYDDLEKENDGILSDKTIKIMYEDDFYMIVYKEAHLQTIPSTANPNDSVYNRLLYYFKDTNNTVHIVNRLDKETTGLVLICKTNFARAALLDYDKIYYAKTDKPLLEEKGIIDLAIARGEGIKRVVSEDGQTAITCYELIDFDGKIYTYKINLKTGRTHQIRVHFSYLGSPLINDTLYGGTIDGNELGLLCGNISFVNPFTNEKIEVNIKY